MIGVLLLSHGMMAEGMLDSCKLFFGTDIPNLKALCFKDGDEASVFKDNIETSIAELDDGSGVVVLCDLFGGTPSNLCVTILNENKNIKVITGMNLGILIEILGTRLSSERLCDLNIADILRVGQNNMVDLSSSINSMSESCDDAFF